MTNNEENKVNQQSAKEKLMNKANGQAPAETKKQSGQTIGEIIDKMMPAIKQALPQHIKPERMARIAITVFRNNPRLQACSPVSFLGAVMQSVQLGLEPNTNLGEAYIIPYGKTSSFQIGYKGILKLAYNTGQYQAIYAHEVYENDEFSYQLGVNKDIYHVPADVPQGEPIYYYAVYKLKNGGYDFAVWSRTKVTQHAEKFSAAVKGKRDTPWKSDFDSMAKKTVLLQALKYAPKSIEFANAIEQDETVKTDLAGQARKMDEIIDIPFDEEGDQQGA
jgi:recombination protein RecT